MPVLPGAEPFAHDGSTELGVLLCHGFTGTPAGMRPWGRYLAHAGLTVRGPRLPGHGTTWQEMNRTRWTDWYGCVRRELLELRQRCDEVFVFGLSMGGTLALRLAQDYGEAVAGLALVNPSVLSLRRETALLPALSKLVPSMAGLGGDIAKPGVVEQAYARTPLRAAASLGSLWRLVRQDLAKITQPVLLMHSSVDHVVEPVNSRVVADGVRSRHLEDVLLERSYHVATLDNDAPMIFDKSLEFVRSHSRAGAR
jgi:carboxylesterase